MMILVGLLVILGVGATLAVLLEALGLGVELYHKVILGLEVDPVLLADQEHAAKLVEGQGVIQRVQCQVVGQDLGVNQEIDQGVDRDQAVV